MIDKKNIFMGGGRNKLLIGQLILMFMLCFAHSLNAGNYSDFFPMNGTFQNFNPVRRLLDGQIPYKDFQDYLGMGHLYVGTIFTILFGGGYNSSLMAFSMLTLLSLAFIILVVGFVIFKKKKNNVVAFINLTLLLLLIQPKFLKYIFGMTISSQKILAGLNAALSVGNSARFIRGMILPITCGLLFVINKVTPVLLKKFKKLNCKKQWLILGEVSLVSGFAAIWSNDYGLGCWVCIAVMTFMCIFSRTRKISKAFLGMTVEILGSLLCIIVLVEMVTLGNFGAWIKAMFGNGGWQNWYYNNSPKAYYFYDIDLSFLTVLQGVLCGIYLVKLFRHSGTIEAMKRYGVLAFANMTCFCVMNEYKLLGGGGLIEVAVSVLFFNILFELWNFIGVLIPKKEIGEKVLFLVSTSLCICLLIIMGKNELKFYKSPKLGVEVEEMGGNMTSLGEDLLNTKKFLNGEKIFSTYATGQEVVTNLFQPSGIDYIIHVLGDESRNKYINSFHTDDFKYTATIKETYTTWETWCRRANWFFYRDLYANWHPVYTNSYAVYWEKNEHKNEHTISERQFVEVEEISDNKKKLVVRTNELTNGYADIYIDYEIKKKDTLLSNFIWKSMLKVQDTGKNYVDEYFDSNYLRPANAEYIPIRIVNGYGELILSSAPEESTYFELKEVSCNAIYTVAYDFVEVIGEDIDENGVFGVKIPKNAYTEDILKNAKTIEIKQQEYPIQEITSDDNIFYAKLDMKGKQLNLGDLTIEENMLKIAR